jgi:hypothetical protein
VSLEKTLTRLEAKARAKTAKPDPARVLAAREQVEALRLTPQRWAAEQQRFALLTLEGQISETRERLTEAQARYREAIAAQKDPSGKGWLADPLGAWISIRACEIRLAELTGASASQVAWMAQRASTLMRNGGWASVAHLDAVTDWEGHRSEASDNDDGVQMIAEPVTTTAPSVPQPNSEPAQPTVEEIPPSFEPGDWN